MGKLLVMVLEYCIGSSAEFHQQESGDIKFFTGGSQRLTIAANGNVGIGTQTSYKLYVDGNCRINSTLRVSGNGGQPTFELHDATPNEHTGEFYLKYIQHYVAGNGRQIEVWKYHNDEFVWGWKARRWTDKMDRKSRFIIEKLLIARRLNHSKSEGR